MDSIEIIYEKRAINRTNLILKDVSHPANEFYDFLPSERRLRTFAGTDRFMNSFFPATSRLYNRK